MDAPCYDHVWMLVESACGQFPKIRRWWSIANHCCSFFGKVERLDVPARGLLSRLRAIATQSHSALSFFDVSPECETVLPTNSRSALASVRVSWSVDDVHSLIVSWQETLVDARALFFRSERGSHARNLQSVPVEDSLQPISVDPKLTTGQSARDGQEDELVSRLLP